MCPAMIRVLFKLDGVTVGYAAIQIMTWREIMVGSVLWHRSA
jgi:hypothetical protein